MAQHTHTNAVSDGSQRFSGDVVITADHEHRIDLALADSTTNLQYNVNIDVSEVKSVLFANTSPVTVTVKANSTSAPTATIPVPANGTVTWYTGQYNATNPLGATDITALYFSVATAGQLSGRILNDATP